MESTFWRSKGVLGSDKRAAGCLQRSTICSHPAAHGLSLIWSKSIMLTARVSEHSSKCIERQKPEAEVSSYVISARTGGRRWTLPDCCQYSKRVRPKLRLLQASE